MERLFASEKNICECVLLYVEDDDAIAYLFQLALRETDVPLFFRVTNGEQAMAFLLQEGAYSGSPRPDLVLLDLNLPRKSGFDVLAEMKGNPRLRQITVLVFSSSALPCDREQSIALGADDYLYKNGEFDTFVNVAKSLCEKMTA